jgi:hypothetical protein
MLCVVSSGRGGTEHVFHVRDAETLCGAKPSRSSDRGDFPMTPDKACAACIVAMVNFAIGNQWIAPS